MLLTLIKTLKAQGYATAEQKANLATLLAKADQATKESVDADVKAINAFAEESEESVLEKGIMSLVKAATKSEVSEAVASIKSEVKAWLESEKEAMTKKAGIYNPAVQEKRKGLNTYMRSFVRAALTEDVAAMKTLNGVASVKELTTDATGSPYGGYAVFQELSTEIRHLVTEYGVARREMTTVQLTKNAYEQNSLATDVTVYWVDEAAAVKSTQVVLGRGELKLKKLGAVVSLTRELLEDEEIDLFGFIGGRIAEAFAKAEDEAFFIGDGTSTYGSFTGLTKLSGLQGVTLASTKVNFSDATADDFLTMQDKVPQGALSNGKYYMHRVVRNVVRKLKGSDGQYIYQSPAGDMPAMLWNKPVVEVETMASVSAVSTVMAIFGDLKQAALLGYKGAISADRFNAGVIRNVADNADINLITTDREAIRFIERVGYIPVLKSAVSFLKTAAS